MKKRYIITVDGPSGAGKSTVAQLLAKRMGYLYLDTGAMYRACAFRAKELGVSLDNLCALKEFLDRLTIEFQLKDDRVRLIVDGKELREEIRTPEIGMLSSEISRYPVVRERMWQIQREIGKEGGIVADGRDMGTVVFPDADFKFFLTASIEERAKRRWLELREKGYDVKLDEVMKEVSRRDEQDSKRELAPLKPAQDAIIVDSSNMGIDEVVKEMLDFIQEKEKRRA